VVESPFAAVRLRTSAAKRLEKVECTTAIIWRLLEVAETRFRKLNAPEQCRDVFRGVRYADASKYWLFRPPRRPPRDALSPASWRDLSLDRGNRLPLAPRVALPPQKWGVDNATVSR
jgi:hypothetical protein